MCVRVLRIPVYDPDPFEVFTRSLLQGANHVLRHGLKIHSGGVLGGDDDLKQARISSPLPLVRDGVERLFASAVKAFMSDPVGPAGSAFSFKVFSVCLPRTLNAGVGVPDVYDRPPLKLPGCSFVLLYGVSLA
jgi:hypothetical protein